MIIKRLNPKNMKELIELNRYCFDFMSEKHLKSLEEDLIKPDEYLGLFIKEQLVAGLWLRPFKMHYEGETVAIYGIANVVSRPEFRSKGYVKTLILKAKDIMQGKSVFSFLSPFSYEFFEKFGWKWATSYLEMRCTIDEFLQFKKYDGDFRMTTPSYSKELIMDDLYEKYMMYNGLLVRDDRLWGTKLGRYSDFPNRHIVMLYDGEQPLGYMVYDIENRQFIVDELVCSVVDKKKFFKYIYGHNMQIDEVILRMPTDDITQHLFKHPNSDVKIKPFMSVLVTDPKKVLELMRGGEVSFNIGIQDESQLITYHVKSHENSNEVYITDEPDFICDIRTFSQLAMRLIDFKEAMQLDQVSLLRDVDETKINKFFYKEGSFINDYF